MIAYTRFMLRFALTAAVATAVLVAIAPFVKTHIVWRNLAKAESMIDAGHPAEASAALAPYEAWTIPYPSIRARFRASLIRALVQSRSLPAAVQVAEREFSDDGKAVEKPAASRLYKAFVMTPASFTDSVFRRTWGLPASTRWSGFEAMLSELTRAGLPSDAADLAEGILKRNPPDRLRPALTACIQSRHQPPHPTPPPAAARATPLLTQPVAETVWTSPPPQASQVTTTPSSPAWALVAETSAPVFGPDGKSIRTVPRSYVLLVHGKRETRSGLLLSCSDPNGAGAGSNLLMRASDVVSYESPWNGMQDETKALLLKRSALSLSAFDLAAQAAEDIKRRNPHSGDFTRASAEYRRFYDEVQRLKEIRDSSTGDTRIEAADRLRALVSKGAELSAAVEDARSRRDAWAAAHAAEAEPPALASLKKQIADATTELSGLGLE